MVFDISYTLDAEVRGLLMNLEKINQGWYLPHGWYVLPDNQNDPNLPICVIPELNYGLWTQYTENNFSTLHPQIKSQLSPSKLISPAYRQVSALFNKIHPDSFPKDFQNYWSRVNFHIHPVRFGAYSFWTLDPQPFHIHLYIRFDQPIDVLVEIAISSVQKQLFDNHLTWHEQEAIGDYLTKIISPHYLGTLERISYKNPELLNKSVDYLHQLHAPVGKLFFEKDNLLYYQDKILNSILSPSERLFLSSLINHYSSCVSYDALAEIVYGRHVDEKYSLWGLRKTAQRLRQKLSKLGAPGQLIQNLSGQGYLLN